MSLVNYLSTANLGRIIILSVLRTEHAGLYIEVLCLSAVDAAAFHIRVLF